MLLVSLKTWPLGMPYPRWVGYQAKEELLSVVTYGFIGCYGDVHGADKGSLCWRGKTGWHGSRLESCAERVRVVLGAVWARVEKFFVRVTEC